MARSELRSYRSPPASKTQSRTTSRPSHMTAERQTPRCTGKRTREPVCADWIKKESAWMRTYRRRIWMVSYLLILRGPHEEETCQFSRTNLFLQLKMNGWPWGAQVTFAPRLSGPPNTFPHQYNHLIERVCCRIVLQA